MFYHVITEFRMSFSTFASLGRQIRHERLKAEMSQRDLASRVGRNAVRISELERDLLQDRWGRDRLTLLVEICDALALDIVLVPRARAAEIESLVRGTPSSIPQGDVTSAFDDLFVDLGEGGDEL
jgi:transcriptional regulator with XRE-family HTH domain